MAYVEGYNDVENPAIAKLGAPKSVDVEQVDGGDDRTCRFWKRGWFWACVIAITTICIAAPLGVQANRRLDAPVEGTPQYKFIGSRGLNTSVLSSYDPKWGLDPKKNLTCDMVTEDMPTVNVAESTPPPPLKFRGSKLVTADEGKEVALHGVNWFGFNNGKTFVDGLDAEQTPSWEGGDFATVVYTLRLLGFNAVRLPFLFADLALPPQDYSKDCPDQAPSEEDLARRATSPLAEQTSNKKVPYRFTKPAGSEPSRCNAYVPNVGTTLARYLWTVQYLVAHGVYVVIDYHPFGVDLETTVTNSVLNYTTAWMRLWLSLTCLPNWQTDLKGRVMLDLLNEPDAMGIVWGGSGNGQAPLENFYFAVMDAIDGQSPGQALFMIQGGGQEKLGSNWGDGFVTDLKMIQERNISDANNFFKTLPSKPYRDQVAVAPHMYGPSISNSPDVGKDLWQKLATSWGYLLDPGYCSSDNSNSSCQAYPVIAGEIGSSFQDPADGPYMKDLAAFMNKAPTSGEYATAKASNWFWWAYNANSADTGGLINDDWQTLDWTKLQWLQENLGLTPWYQQ